MFDKLVESTKQNQGRRARRLFLATGAVYAVALIALGVAAIVGFNSALAEKYDLTTVLVPPAPSGPAPRQAARQPNLKQAPALRFEPPNVKDLPVLENLKKLDFGGKRETIVGAPYLLGTYREGGVPGAPNIDDPPPPPVPPPPPAVKPAATPTPPPLVRLTSALTQGRVLRRVQPPYPAIARQARVQGQVQVQISISETGAVTEVTLLSGNPLLRDAALQAARQWTFIPTELNGQKVRAVGLLTFNFKLD